MSKKTNAPLIKDPSEAAKALEILFATQHINKKKLYIENAVRGIFFGAGGVLGATILIAILLWVLSLFDQIPLIGPLFENTRETIERGSTLN